MRIPLYQVDAFTTRLFGGNPAAVCPLSEWLPEATMQAIAAENNLAETAFFVPQGDAYLLRWFTPTVEVELCGHATLASGYVVTRILAPERRSVTFDTLKAGPLVVTREGERLAADVARTATAVNKLVTARINQNQFDALVDFAFNLGTGALASSTLLRCINAGDFAAAAREFPRWDRAQGRMTPGLLRRRLAEAALFTRPILNEQRATSNEQLTSPAQP